jgi:hypothetical protein
MKDPQTSRPATTASARKSRRLGAAVAAFALLLPLASAGCIDATDEVAREFRAAAGDSLETAFNAFADGVISGLFAVVEPDVNPDSDVTPNDANATQ